MRNSGHGYKHLACRLIAWAALLALVAAAQHPDSVGRTQNPGTHRAYSLAHRESCGELALQLGVPQVALLFLTVGDLPFNTAWRAWLSTVNGKLPALSITASCMGTNTTNVTAFHKRTIPEAFLEQHPMSQLDPSHTSELHELATSCHALNNDPATPALFRQQLYNIYSHTPPDFDVYSPDSLLYGRRITQRVASKRLSHTLITVERFLLKEALQWSLNTRFVFLSESHMPLYPAATVYMQLVHEPRARINACHQYTEPDYISWWRWKPELCPWEHWRKSSHWITLTRPVASVILNERQVNAAFEQHCLDSCSNIEHYIPTMLAVHNLENLTSCVWGSTYVDWSRKSTGGHPRTFKTNDLSKEFLQFARTWHCPPMDFWAPVHSAQRGLVDVNLLQEGPVCNVAATAPEYAVLDVACSLFVRKIDKDASDLVTTLVTGLEEEAAYSVEAAYPWRSSVSSGAEVEEGAIF